MKRKFINKIVAGAIISTTLCTLVPIKASAEWVKDYQGSWYYMQDNERMTGWKRIDGQLYYFDDNGKMLTGWIKAGDYWYFLQNNGALRIGWIKYNKNWYYADSSGSIQTGIINIAGKVYIFDDNGILKTNNTVINGEFYTIGSDGEVVGAKVPTPNKELDESGNCIQVLKNTDNKLTGSPTDSRFNEVVSDQSESDKDPNEGRIFKVILKDSNGADLKTKSFKYGKTVELYEPTKVKYNFVGWNTKSDGSGKSYSADDDIKVKGDIILYAQWTADTSIFVDGITIKGSSYVTVNKTIQMTAEVSPNDAANKGINWSVIDGTGKATIDSSGVLTGVSSGAVTVKATSKDGSNISSTKQVNITSVDAVVSVAKITVNSKTGSYLINTNLGTLQMTTSVLPNDATDPSVEWTVENGTGSADIDSTGLVKAKSNGTVTVKATAKDGSKVVGSRTITITGQSMQVLPTGITVSGSGGSAINADGGTLQMVATVSPSSATNKSVNWIVESKDGNGKATISNSGVLTAVANGKVMVTAISLANSSVVGSTVIDINNQSNKVTSISVLSDSDKIDIDGQKMQMKAEVSPIDNTVDTTIIWSVEQYGDAGTKMTGKASVDSNGLLTPLADGTVKVKATSKKVPTIFGSKEITIKNQSIKATGLAITPDEIKELDTKEGSSPEIQLGAVITPSNASNTTSGAVQWKVTDVTGHAEFVSGKPGLLRVLKNGTILVTASTTDGSNISVSKAIIISGLITKAYSASIVAKETTTGGSDHVSTITQKGGSLQMRVVLDPADAASNRTVEWSVEPLLDSFGNATIKAMATISETGVLTASDNGTVKVKAKITYRIVELNADGSVPLNTNGTVKYTIEEIPAEKIITITGQPIYVSDISINNTTNLSIVEGSTLQMAATVNPSDATNKLINWSVTSAANSSGSASIDPDGLLRAKTAGDIVVRATATDGSGKFGERTITITPKSTT